jgi:hypothetical protein
MKYEEPIATVAIPISILRRVGECIRTDMLVNMHSESRAEMLKNAKNERALQIIDAVLTEHEANAIIGDSLSDENLKKVFSTKKRNRKKQND